MGGRGDSEPSIRVWDPVVRLSHWALVLSVSAAWYTREGWGIWHERVGYAVLLVLALRIAWGGAGPDAARFSRFVRAPAATWRYTLQLLKRAEPRYVGHNPLGAWMILALLLSAAAAGLSGWLYTTDAFWGEAWLEWVHYLCAVILIALAALHVAGVVVTSVLQRENLVGAMVHGRKRPPAKDDIPA